MGTPSVEQVQALLPAAFPIGLVEAMIADATLMLEDCAGYSTERRSAIVKYLAAHLLASTQRSAAGVASKSIDGVSYSYRGPVLGEGLKGTPFGQMALSFDTNGCLLRAGMPVKVALL